MEKAFGIRQGELKVRSLKDGKARGQLVVLGIGGCVSG